MHDLKIRRRRRLVLALGVLVAGASLLAGLAVRSRLDNWVRQAIETRLSETLGGEVRLEALALDLGRLEAAFEGLSIVVPAPPAGPLRLSVPRGRLRLPWNGILAFPAGRIHLRELVLERPLLDSTREFWIARQRFRSPRPRPLDLRIDRLELADGRLLYDDRTSELELSVEDLALAASWDAWRQALSGEAAASLTLVRAPFGRPLPLAVKSRFHWGPRDLELMDLSALGPGLDLSGEATVGWVDSFSLAGRGEVRADLDRLAPLIDPGFPAVSGRVHGSFAVEQGPEPLSIRGTFDAEQPRFGRLVAEAARAFVRYTPGRLELFELQSRAFDGDLSGTVAVTWPDPTRFTADLAGKSLQAAAFLGWLGIPLPLNSRLDGTLRLEGDADRLATWTGSARFDARPGPAGGPGIETRGSGDLLLDRGRLRLRAPEASLAGARLDLALESDLGGAVRSGTLRLSGDTASAEKTQQATFEILDALDVELPEFLERPLAGAGPVSATISLGPQTQLSLALRLDEGAWGPRRFDRLALAFDLQGEQLAIHELELRNGIERAAGSARLHLVPLAIDELHLEAESLDAGWVNELAELDVVPTGKLSGRIDVRQGEHGSIGDGQLVLVGSQWLGEPLEEIAGRIEVHPHGIRVHDLVLRGPALEATGAAAWEAATSTLTLEVERGRMELAGLQAVAARRLPIRGQLDLTGDVRVGRSRIEGQLQLSSPDLEIQGWALGASHGMLDLGTAGVGLRLEGGDPAAWAIAGRVGLSEEFPVDALVTLSALPVAVAAGDPSAGTVWLSGQLAVSGPLETPERLKISGTIEQAEIQIGATRVTTAAPFAVHLENQVLEAGPARLLGTGSDLELTLSYNVKNDRVGARAAGHADIGLMAAFFPEIRGSGRVDIDLHADGPFASPVVSGMLEAADARLRWLGYSQVLDEIAFRVALAGNRAELQHLRARLGNGEIRATGGGEISGLGLAHYSAQIEVANVRATYPEGFRGVYEGQLRIEGDAEEATLWGRLFLLRGSYEEEFGLGQLLGSGDREYDAADALALPGNLFLDVSITADGNIWVRNELAEVQAGCDLYVGGTLQRPELTGRIFLLDGGKIWFRDVEYRILYGSLDFFDLDRLNPYLTLRAQTKVRDYLVLLRIEGSLNRFEYDLTSEPPLASQDIIALLTTGSTYEELNPIGEGGGAGFSGDLAANYFAGALTGRFTKPLERRLHLEQVSINPLLVQGEVDPTTRVTVGKRVSEDVRVVVSSDIGHTERQLYQINWETTPKFSLNAERDTLGGIGGDVQYSDRFFWRKPVLRIEPAQTTTDEHAADGETTAPTVTSIQLQGVSETDRTKLEAALGFKALDPFSRSTMFGGVEAIRRYFVRSGRLQAKVDASATPRAAGMEVVYVIDPGPVVVVSFEGVDAKETRQLRALLEEAWAESVFSEDLYQDSADLIHEFFQDRGHYAVDVQYEVQEHDGQRLARFAIDRGEPVVVRAVSLVGPNAVDEERIRRQMLTRPSSLFARRVLVPAVLDDDIAAIRNLYRDLGYLRIQIAAPRVRLSAEGDTAEIELTIAEGPRFTLSEIDITGELPFPEATLLDWCGLELGEVFSPSRLLLAENTLRHALDDRGYPEARVRGSFELADGTTRIELELDPGGLKRVREVAIEGNRLTKDKIIHRELTLGTGDLISRESLLASQQRLYKLGIFRNVKVVYQPAGGDDPVPQRLLVAVEESPPFSTTLAVGYDTEAGPKFSFSLSDENVGGYDRVASVQGRVSGIEKRLQFVAKEPRLFTRKLPALLNLGWEERQEEEFSFERTTAALRVDRSFNKLWSAYARYGLQRVDTFDVQDPEKLQAEKLEDVRLGDIGAAIARDSRDDPILPTRGSQLTISTRVFAEPFLSERSFVKSTFAGTLIRTNDRGLTFASALRIGAIMDFGPDEPVPVSEGFFAGGDSTLRGFRRDAVGPPDGGEGLFLLNEELRFPIWRQLKGVVFYDAGNIYPELSDFDVTDLRHVLGTGLRVDTPFGPLRLEYGRKLDRNERDPSGERESSGELFLAIGGAF